MATGTVGQHQVATFVSPVNGTTPIDANQVRGNDNTIKTGYDAHDNDATIHFQNSTLAARPVASTPGQKWMTSDGFRIYYDDGSAWNEAAYLPTAGGTVSGNVTITGTLTQTGLATFNGGATIASGQTLTLTGVTVSTINGQTISSVAAFTGTVTVATGLTVTAGGLTVSAGTTAVRALTATTLVMTGDLSGVTGITLAAGATISNSNFLTLTCASTVCAFLGASSPGSVQFPGIGTTATAGNAFVDNTASNKLLRSTSSLRYKNVLGDLALHEARHIVLKARAICYTSKEGSREHIGLVAEEMHALDPRITTVDTLGRPDWVQYPHLVAPLMLVAQDHEKRIAALESRMPS